MTKHSSVEEHRNHGATGKPESGIADTRMPAFPFALRLRGARSPSSNESEPDLEFIVLNDLEVRERRVW